MQVIPLKEMNMQVTRSYVGGLFFLLQFVSFVSTYAVKIKALEHSLNDPRKELQIGVILPSHITYPWALRKTLPAIQCAVDTINMNQPRRLLNHVLRIVVGDSYCSDTIGPLVAINMHLKHNVSVFFGPVCEYSVAPVARFSPHWNVPLVTGGALVQHFRDKSHYGQLTRMVGPYHKLGTFIATIFDFFNFVQTAFIYGNNLGYRAGKYGRSPCYFTTEAMFLALQIPFKQRHGRKKDLWSKPFDENQPGTFSFTELLMEASQHARGKYLIGFDLF